MEALQIEHALISAVEQKKDFYQSASWIQTILMQITNEDERKKVFADLLDFLQQYQCPKN